MDGREMLFLIFGLRNLGLWENQGLFSWAPVPLSQHRGSLWVFPAFGVQWICQERLYLFTSSQTNPWHWGELLLLLEPAQAPGLVLHLVTPESFPLSWGISLVCPTPAAAGWGGWGSLFPAFPKGHSPPVSLQVFWPPQG